MGKSLVDETNAEVEGLVNAWCDRRAIGPLRVVLTFYPLTNNLTDDWAALAAGLKGIRARHAQELDSTELDTVVRLQQLADSLVHR